MAEETQHPSQSPGEAELVTQETPPAAPWWSRPETWSLLARLVMGSTGVAAIVVGLIAAERANLSTTALIVGAVLIVLAILFKPDLTELGGEYGPREVHLSQKRRDRQRGTTRAVHKHFAGRAD